MKSIKNLKYVKLGIISLFMIVVLTAFGCKEQESKTDGDAVKSDINPTEQITYNQVETKDIENDNSQTEKDNTESTSNNSSEENSKDTNSKNNDEELLLEKAEKLAEIFGTFTNKDKVAYKNLKDLKQYSTGSLSSWIDKKSKDKIDSNTPFYGATTSALSSVYLEQSNSKNKILVTVKKEEITSANNIPKISYRVILMTFEKLEDKWNLSGIYWQD